MSLRKCLALLLIFLCLPGCGQAAESCTFPDMGYLLTTEVIPGQTNYAFSETFVCDAYYWDYPSDWKAKFDPHLPLLPMLHGWTYEATQVEGHDAYAFTGPNGETAILVPRFGKQLLLLVPVGCQLVWPGPVEPTPEPTAIPTAEPASQPDWDVYVPDTSSSGSWEWQYNEVDCPECFGGRCPVCNGSGIYRNFGVSVDCDPDCAACDGKGTFMQRDYVYVPGY